MRKRRDKPTSAPELLKSMAEMWKHLHGEGAIDSEFNQEKFDFLAKLFAGKMDGQEGHTDE